MNTIVILEVSSWIGISIGAIHFYGKLVGYDQNDEYKSIDLKCRLTARQATKLNKQHDWDMWKRDDEYNGFDSRQDVIDFAIKVWKEHFPHGQMLILGQFATAEPQPVLVGPKFPSDRINNLALRAEEIGYWDKGHDREMERICDEWSKLIAPFRNYSEQFAANGETRPG